MDSLSDEELVARYRGAQGASDGRPFINALFERHHARVVSWCYRLSGSRESAYDLAQDVFAKAFAGLHTFRSNARFTTWLYVIVRNCCNDEARRRAVRPREVVDEDGLEALQFTHNDALAVLDAESARKTVQDLMRGSLDETEIRVMTLHYGHDMPLQAVTSLLGLTNTSGAKAYIVSAKRKLNGAVARWKSRQDRLAGERR
jgi:RNA polymerase sigma-70 factor (ECF subfamily)